jgi:hypothetical protein
MGRNYQAVSTPCALWAKILIKAKMAKKYAENTHEWSKPSN